MHTNLRCLDLDLLVIFDSLYRHRSALAASEELALSPSAFSHALARLRETFKDELFVLYGSAMRPTAHAEHVARAVSDALSLLSDNLGSSASFVPETSTQEFTLAATDFAAFSVLPRLLARVERLAPGVRINVVYSSQQDSLNDVEAGRAQFALRFSEADSVVSEGVHSVECFSDDYVVAVRKGHPRVADTLTLDQYLAEKHVAVLPWASSGSVIDAALTTLGRRRTVAVQLPSLLSAPFIVSGTDLLLTLPRRAVEQMNHLTNLTIVSTPFPSPTYTIAAYFHVKHAGSPGYLWFRHQLKSAFTDEA